MTNIDTHHHHVVELLRAASASARLEPSSLSTSTSTASRPPPRYPLSPMDPTSWYVFSTCPSTPLHLHLLCATALWLLLTLAPAAVVGTQDDRALYIDEAAVYRLLRSSQLSAEQRMQADCFIQLRRSRQRYLSRNTWRAPPLPLPHLLPILLLLSLISSDLICAYCLIFCHPEEIPTPVNLSPAECRRDGRSRPSPSSTCCSHSVPTTMLCVGWSRIYDAMRAIELRAFDMAHQYLISSNALLREDADTIGGNLSR